jgi:hypothetical protein
VCPPAGDHEAAGRRNPVAEGSGSELAALGSPSVAGGSAAGAGRSRELEHATTSSIAIPAARISR